MRVLFIISGNNNGSRLRIQNYLKHWIDYGIQADCFQWNQELQDKTTIELERVANNFDVLYLYRTLIPQTILVKFKAKNILIFDFDDAVFFVPETIDQKIKLYSRFAEYSKRVYRYIKRGNAFYSIRHEYLKDNLKYFDLVVVCNKYLENYVHKYNTNTFISATPIEKDNDVVKSNYNKLPIKIGWIGTMVNQRYLINLQGIFTNLDKKYNENIKLKIISQDLIIKIKDINVEFVKWSIDAECENILDFDIGIMPLTNDGWSQGKCAYKAIQMMSYGVPVIISSVGMNNSIIFDGENGFIPKVNSEWLDAFEKLIDSSELRKRIGENGLSTVEKVFSRKYLQTLLSNRLQEIFKAKNG